MWKGFKMKKLALLLLCLVLIFSMTSCDSVLDLLLSEISPSNSESSSESSLPESESSTDIESSEQSSESSSSEEFSSSSEESSVIVPPGHTHSFTDSVVAPGCVDKGYTKHLCDCGYYYLDTFTSAVGQHDFESGVCTVCDEVDYAELINIISTNTIKANVTVKSKYSNRAFAGLESVVGVSNGSGAIIKHTENEYYVLTNNHVVYNESLEESTSHTTYFVIDYIGTEYQATLVARLASYDLAIVKFTSEEAYTVLSLEGGNSEADDLVISLGQPEGQSNTITLGNTVGYTRVALKDTKASESNVQFNVLHHDAYINSGSSGGALLDAKLNIIGINYAGALDEDGNNVGSYAIPVEKVYEFFERVSFAYETEATE